MKGRREAALPSFLTAPRDGAETGVVRREDPHAKAAPVAREAHESRSTPLARARDALLDLLFSPWTRRLSRRALRFGAEDLGIRWPVKVAWRTDIGRRRGQVEPSVKYEIQVRSPQNLRETARTIFHELYHIAQFHKWKDLDPKDVRRSADDLERAESLAELYAQVTARSFLKERRRNPWRKERHRIG